MTFVFNRFPFAGSSSLLSLQTSLSADLSGFSLTSADAGHRSPASRYSESAGSLLGLRSDTAFLAVNGPNITLRVVGETACDPAPVVSAVRNLLLGREEGEARARGEIAQMIRTNHQFLRRILTDGRRSADLDVSLFADADLTLLRLVVREGEKEIVALGAPLESMMNPVNVEWKIPAAPKRIGPRALTLPSPAAAPRPNPEPDVVASPPPTLMAEFAPSMPVQDQALVSPPTVEFLESPESKEATQDPIEAGSLTSLFARLEEFLLPGLPSKDVLERAQTYLHATDEQRFYLIPPTIAQFREIRGHLADISNPSVDALVGKYIEKIDRALDQRAHLTFSLPEDVADNYQWLSDTAKEGFYLASLKLDRRGLDELVLFLSNPELQAVEIEAVLSLMSLLHDRGVRGYEALVPKFNDPSNVVSGFYNELAAAMAYAQSPLVARATLSPNFAVDKTDLTAREKISFPANMQTVEADIVCETTNGRRRLVEMKSSTCGKMILDADKRDAFLNQAVRLAAVARQQRMEVFEYFIYSRSVDQGLLDDLEDVLVSSGIPFAISVHHEENSDVEVRASEGVHPLPLNTVLPSERLRPLPPPTRNGNNHAKASESGNPPKPKSNPPKALTQESGPIGNQLPWNPAMITFLNVHLSETSDRKNSKRSLKLSKSATRSEAEHYLQLNFRIVSQQALHFSVAEWISTSDDLESRRKSLIRERLAALSESVNDWITLRKLEIIFEIAAIATGWSPANSGRDWTDAVRGEIPAIIDWLKKGADDLRTRQFLLDDDTIDEDARVKLAGEQPTHDYQIEGLAVSLTVPELERLLREKPTEPAFRNVHRFFDEFQNRHRALQALSQAILTSEQKGSL